MSGGRKTHHEDSFFHRSGDPGLAAVAGAQGGHVTKQQLLALGFSRRAIDHRRARGLLIQVHHGVYAVGHPPTHPFDRAHGALLAAGERSALAGASAMALDGLTRSWPEPLELVVAGDRRIPNLTIHRGRTLLARDVVIRERLRVTSPARTLLDIAPRLSEFRFVRALNELRMDHALTVGAIEDVVVRNPRHPGTRRLSIELMRAQAEPTRSELERAFLALVSRHRLPTPQVNVRVAGHRVDAYFPGHRLIVELDGWATHGTRAAFRRDRRQDAEILAATGIPTVRLSYEDTTANAAATAERLSTILGARR